MQVHYFMNMETIIVIWHLIKRHKQLPGLVYEVRTSLYACTGCNWKDSFAGEEVQHDPATLFCFRKFSLVLLMPPCVFHVSYIQWVVTYMLLIKAFVTNIIMYSSDFIMQIIKQMWPSFRDWIHILKKKTDQAQFMQLDSFDPGYKCFRMKTNLLCTMQWYQFSIAGNPVSKQRPGNKDI